VTDQAVIHLRPRQAPASAPVLLTTAQAAERLQVSVRTLRRWLRSGSVPHVRLGQDERLVRIPVDLLDEWWQRRQQGGKV
jgi:excisionase family DNA binding protein